MRIFPCYAQSVDYELINVNLDDDIYAKTTCAEFQDYNFRRHCILAQYLIKSDATYAMAMDADVAVVNPNHCVEDYIVSNSSLIFYERFHTFEVAACSFIVKNDEYGREFLMNWARYSRKVPSVSWANSDNGALLSLLLEKRFVSGHERKMCTKIWQNANALNDYLQYIHCVYIFLGSKRNDLIERIRILRRGHGWGRDSWTSDGKWCDHDFLLHAIKADDYNSNVNDVSLPFSEPVKLVDCKLGQSFNITFQMKPEQHLPCDDLAKRLQNRLIVPRTLAVPYLDDSDLECWPKCDEQT
uniref:Nucleotide-diphospho-sugar transferase domain-containing protein n=1 Tax=Plectus sambesii TaxID=2011161 RepID=A0A914W096_9BILA